MKRTGFNPRIVGTKRMCLGLCFCLTLLLTVPATNCYAEYWLNYYETGSGLPPNIVWSTQYYIDVDSTRRDGSLLTYRTKVYHLDDNRTEIYQMLVDCAAKTRGQLPSRELYPTYKDPTFGETIGSKELKTVCKLAAQRGI